MTNNFKQIKSLLKFEDENEFYFIQIIQRKKEHELLGKNNRVIKTYYIYSLDLFNKVSQEIINYCTYFNARAYINLNRRNSKKISLETMELLARSINCNNFNQLHKLYNSVCGKHQSTKDKTWIIDIDEKDNDIINAISSDINDCMPEGQKIIAKIPTKNGFHLITKPFDLRIFSNNHPEVDVHKNNPTILFCL